MLIGRKAEMEKLRTAILSRRSLLIHGPAGSGKSALLQAALESLPGKIRAHCLFCAACDTPHEIWQHLVVALGAVGDPVVLERVRREARTVPAMESWVKRQTSLRLRGILRRAVRATDYLVFFDPPHPLPDGAYRLLQEWIWSGRVPVYLTARSLSETASGRIGGLFWHAGLRFPLGPLCRSEAELLLEHSIAAFGLAPGAGREFRDFVLHQSCLLPGRIVHLCRLASSPAYRFEGRLKLHTLAVDSLLEPQEIARAVKRKAAP